MTATTERTISGQRLVLIGFAVAAVFVFGSAAVAPALRDDVLQTTHPRTLREPIATGRTASGQVWEAVAHDDGTANCLELRYRGEVLDRACDDAGGDGDVRAITVTQVPDGPAVAYGLAEEHLRSVNAVLEAGTTITVPVKAGDLGFPVGFWATALPDGAQLSKVEPTAG